MTLEINRLTERSGRVLELALREALSLGHNYVGPEHLLLAIAREGDSLGALLLRDYGLDASALGKRLAQLTSNKAAA